MKLKVFDIPEDGMDFRASASHVRDRWFEGLVVDAFREDYPKGNPAELDLHILRTSDNVQLSGAAEVTLKPSCARCLDPFEKRVSVPLHVNLAPHKSMHFEEDENEDGLDQEDVAFSFYKGEEIDLSEIIREMLLLDIPLRYLCSESCKGLCPRCGRNLNVDSCACAKTPADPRFAVLKQFPKS
jgi:uncharacterized protein